MKRTFLVILSFLVLSVIANAAHIKGGFFTYRYLGPGAAGNVRYQVTLTVYMVCNPSSGQLSNPINFSIYNGNNQLVRDVSVPITNQYNLNKVYDEPCITGNETGCYYTIVVYNLPSVELPITPDGYTIAYQRCCRIAGINNIIASNTVGNTFAIRIPGSATAAGAETNSSPAFQVNDTAVVCRNSFFQYSFEASDIDGDSLSYEFCPAIEGGSQSNPSPTTAANPPYTAVTYQSPFSGSRPLGTGVTIDPVTGIISGIAPDILGEFVVSVCVKEYRNGVLIGRSPKELHIRVNDCQPLRALLAPSIITCDGFTLDFQNQVSNPTGAQYVWTFGDPTSGSSDTSFLPNPSHTYADTGVYIVKLVVSLAGGLCADSTTMQARVFPGFFPNFTAAGGCFTNPFQFTDLTATTYGVVNSWQWNFGDLSTLADTSRIRNPQWVYAGSGTKTVELIVTNSKGCKDTTTLDVEVFDKPPITLAFNDTLICRFDAVQLNATGLGSFSWTPLTNIINPNTGTPTVDPPSTTKYYVTLNDNGCISTDSVTIRVINSVTIQTINDTTICQGDSLQLNAISDGLRFSWTPVANLSNPNIINPIAITNSTTVYNVVATVGSCSASDQVVVTTVPYPIANAGTDPTICYNTSSQLNGAIVGSSFNWSPPSYLSNPTILNPISSPPRTTTYILSAYDTLGCPKPGRDTVVVNVQPKVIAYAGRDTSVVVGQPLLLQGSGGINYVWSPGIGLSSTTIPNPIGTYGPQTDSVKYKLIVTDATGCPDSAYVTVYVFKTNPYVFVPSAFTPNNDGKNDVVRPIAVGVEKINFFSVYNRWGELVFTTTANKQGWDGRIGGVLQATNVFVWMVSAVDYTGKTIFLKGTVTLIR